ncbi:MAG: glycosyltransferase family 2 protein [Bacteroidales bacterium]|nr:glycosyltransferase family 2 protein [Bacteroidales bacterium]
MNKKTKVAVVILNWNGKKFLEQFLPSVIHFSKSDEVRITVADNASSDDSITFLRKYYSEDVDIIILDKNYGFAGGYNNALKQIESEYYILLNSDVEVTKNWINPVIHYMESNTDVAACMPKILAYHEKNTFEYAGAAGGYIDVLGYPFCRGRIFETCEKDEGQYDDVADIFWATGACMFVRSEIFNGLGGFDNDFFAHMEEIDLCWRLKNTGYRIVYVPSSSVYHVGGGTLPKGNPRKTYLNFRNSLFMLYKNLPHQNVNTRIFRRLCMDMISALRFLFKLKFKDVLAIFKAHIDFYRKKRLIRKKRIGERVNNLYHNEIYKRNIVWQYYLKRKKTFKSLNF